MARLRQAEALPAPTGGVPVELLDRRHRVWSDNRSVARWREANGVPPSPPFNVEFHPLPGEPDDAGIHRGGRVRWRRAASDWALAHSIDHRRLRELLQGAL